MPGLTVQSDPLVARDKPNPTSVAQLASTIKAGGPVDPQAVAQALLTLQKSLDDIHAVLRQNAPAIGDILVTDNNGNLVAHFGRLPTEDGRILYGIQGISLYVGDVLGQRDPADAPFWADSEGHVFLGKNGWLDVLDPYGNDAAWLGTQFDTFPVTGAVSNGGLIRLTVAGHTLLTGDVARVLNVGGVPNAKGLFTVTKIDADHLDLQNSVFAGLYTAGGTVDRLLHVTGAANNGAGLIRLTVTAHGYETGDVANVLSVGGVPNATGQWILTVFDANHVDLQGSTWAGAYTSGGLALRYAAGGNFQNIAIGPSFWNYRLRAFPDGSLKIKNALITLVGSGTGSATITLDPTLGTIKVESNAAGSHLVTDLDAGGVTLHASTAHTPAAFIANSSIQIWTVATFTGGVWVVVGPSVAILPDLISLSDAGGAATITLTGSTGGIAGKLLNISGALINASREASNFASMDSALYKVGGVPGIGAAESPIIDITFTSGPVVTSVSGIGVSSTMGTALYGVATITQKTLTFASGLITGDV
jgi:hypothetical protein